MNVQTLPTEPVQPAFVSKATAPALAKKIAEWFPELDGRSLAVSEAKITRDNVPTLPLVMVSLVREVGSHTVRTNRIEPEEQLVVEFWFEPARYTNSNGTETPFWSFYDYDTLRDRLVTHLKHWFTPRGERMEYFSLDVDSDQFATVITFQLRHKFIFCEPEQYYKYTEDGHLIEDIPFCLCTPSAYCEVLDEVVDPCAPTAKTT